MPVAPHWRGSEARQVWSAFVTLIFKLTHDRAESRPGVSGNVDMTVDAAGLEARAT